MSDFSPDKARQMAREFKVGISILAVLFCVFVGVAYRHYRKSFVDPPPQFASRSTSAGAQNELTDDSRTPAVLTSAVGEERPSRFIPPTYDQAMDDVVGLHPARTPQRLTDNIRVARRAEPEGNRTGGGSFRPVETNDHTDESSTADLSPARPPISGPPNAGLPTDRDSSPSLDSRRPAAIDPASFEQNSSRPADVQRTEFQSRDKTEPTIELTLPDLRPRALASPPQTFRSDGPSRPIDQSVRVEPIRIDDSFWLISQRAYGSGEFFRALYEHNREHFPEPDDLPVGSTVEIPAVDFLKKHYQEFCPQTAFPKNPQPSTEDSIARDYTVVGGESLFDVARFQLGQGSRYVEILKLNRDVLGDRVEDLPAGLRLQLPSR